MRTTVTLDSDVERLIRATMKQRGVTFKQALNDAVRASRPSHTAAPRKRFVQRTYSLGKRQNFCWDKALAAADALEDEALMTRYSSGR